MGESTDFRALNTMMLVADAPAEVVAKVDALLVAAWCLVTWGAFAWFAWWLFPRLSVYFWGIGTEGTVIHVEERRKATASLQGGGAGGTKVLRRPTIAYVDQQGATQKAVGDFTSSDRYHKGMTLPIRYLPDRPEVIVYDPDQVVVKGMVALTLGVLVVWSLLYFCGLVPTVAPFLSSLLEWMKTRRR